MDNAKPHYSKMLKEWVARNKNKIELFYLPPYSPDLNPDEHINSDVKYGDAKTDEAGRYEVGYKARPAYAVLKC